jgi:predicted nucleic acid-binding protein
VTGYESLIGSMTNHPKDRHVLAAAVAGRADVLVTESTDLTAGVWQWF